MILNIDINSKEWADVVFANKNHNYGAYELRTTEQKRLWTSFLIAVSFFVVAICAPLLLTKVIHPTHDANTDPHILDGIVVITPPKDAVIVPPAVLLPKKLRESIKFVQPLIVEDDPDIDDKMETQADLLKSPAAIGVVDSKGENNPTLEMPQTATEVFGGEGDGTIVTNIEQMPEYPGGERELMRYLNANVRYPYSAQERGIAGRVVCEFVVNRDGSICDARVIKGVEPSLDAEALRVINRMPAWKPGKQQGVTVRVRYTLPITFSLATGDN